MASAEPAPDRRTALRGGAWAELWSGRMLLLCWAPILAIGLLHYGTHPSEAWLHNVLRRLYYLPIIVAAYQGGLRGGLVASVVVSLTYVPHAFFSIGHLAHIDPAGGWEKSLEIVLYNAVGAVAGSLAGAERRRRAELEVAIDEQKRLQTQLVRAGRLGALGELVAGVTHEIKTPLHALRGTAEIVDPLIPHDAPERRMWEIHMSELKRLGDIAERFRSFASPRPAEMRELDLNEVAARLSDLVGPQARKHHIEVASVTSDGAALVNADRDQLAQVALNIAVNAIHAIGEDGGAIRVSVIENTEHGGAPMHALRIENDGPPIPEGQIEHLFDPFVSTDPDGTGLGLSICERIVGLHGGYIVAANAGLGVTFTVFLPRAEPDQDKG